jgi:RHH-type transcriptional regulator, rel operon repressor / antitoxin RelB
LTGEARRLEALAESTGRSRSFLAADAINAYFDINELQVAGIKKAIQSMCANGDVDHVDVKDWVANWGNPSAPDKIPLTRKS